MEQSPKIKLTTFWDEYYEFMRRLLGVYSKGKITKNQYEFFKMFKDKLPYHDMKGDPNAKFMINTVSRLFVNNAWFRKIFDGYTLDLRNSMVWSMKIAADSKKMRQKMYDCMLAQDPDGFNEPDTNVLDRAKSAPTPKAIAAAASKQQVVSPKSISTPSAPKYYSPGELRKAAMTTLNLTESDMAVKGMHTHKYGYEEYFEDGPDAIRLQFDTGNVSDWESGGTWTHRVFAATKPDETDEMCDVTSHVMKSKNNYTADIISSRDAIRNGRNDEGYATYAEARAEILHYFGLR